ncbi:hypothetical protein [Nostoc sp.]|uniref:hypothetical protein n=1 Tax=Nostoc sp. TaxID=1180 RepID=UPI002FF8B409
MLETLLLDAMCMMGYAYALMAARGKSILASCSLQVVGYFSKYDMVLLIASGSSLQTASISEVMHTSVITLNVS